MTGWINKTGFLIVSIAILYPVLLSAQILIRNYNTFPEKEVWQQSLNKTTEISSGTINITNSKEIILYPNPATEMVNLAGIPVHSTISIISISGQTIMSLNSNSENVVIDVRNLRTGVYFVRIGDKERKTFKLLKQ